MTDDKPDRTTESGAPVVEHPIPLGPDDGVGAPAERPADREARYRKRAQEAETERDRLAELVAGFRRSEVERRLSDTMTNPADVWHEYTIADVLDKAGAIDDAKVQAVSAAIETAHPNWMIQRSPIHGNQRPAGPIARMQEIEYRDRWRGAFTPKT